MAKQPKRAQPKPHVLPEGFPPRVEPRAPHAPGTKAQGYLSSRWERRNGNIYTHIRPQHGEA